MIPLKKLNDISLLVGPLLPEFSLDFKARVDSFTWMIHWLHAMESSDSPLGRHLLTSLEPAWQLSHFDPRASIGGAGVQNQACHCLTVCDKTDVLPTEQSPKTVVLDSLMPSQLSYLGKCLTPLLFEHQLTFELR